MPNLHSVGRVAIMHRIGQNHDLMMTTASRALQLADRARRREALLGRLEIEAAEQAVLRAALDRDRMCVSSQHNAVLTLQEKAAQC